MDNYIRKLSVKSLFNEKTNLSLDFDEKVNCLFGVNGSGKTTVINLLVASLFCDAFKLSTLAFTSVIVSIAHTGKKKARPFFEVTKMANGVAYRFFPEFVDSEKDEAAEFIFPDISRKEVSRAEEIKKQKVLERIKVHVSTTYVPLSRLHDSEIYDSDYLLSQAMRVRHIPQEDMEDFLDPSRRMLLKLEANFKQKYAETQKEINKNLDGLKDTILEKMLINQQFANKYSKQNISLKSKFTKPVYEQFQTKLQSANLKISDTALSQHFEIMEVNINKLNTLRDDYNQLFNTTSEVKNKDKLLKEISDSYSIEASKYRALNPIYERFFDVLEDVENIQAKKEELLKPFTETAKLINEFLINKSFLFTPTGGFDIHCNGREIKLADLSSGEKHMIALLGRVALSPEQGAVFVADEPELSLHLEWQRKIIPAIQSLSPSIQIIVATHSPAIIPDSAKMIDLESSVK